MHMKNISKGYVSVVVNCYKTLTNNNYSLGRSWNFVLSNSTLNYLSSTSIDISITPLFSTDIIFSTF